MTLVFAQFSIAEGGGTRRARWLAGIALAGLAMVLEPTGGQAAEAAAERAAAIAESSNAATAEDPGNVGETIIVTARRVAEDLQTVPLTIRVLGAERIEREAVRNLTDVARLIPGLTFDIGAFPNDTRPAIRGMQAERGRPSVAVMLDGNDLSGENLSIAGGTAGVLNQLLDIERIEVVKGPQSTLYGRNAFAGAINYISRRPSFTHGLRASVELATDDQAEVTASVTGPIIADRLAFKLDGALRTRDGAYRNPVTGGRLGGEAVSIGSAALRWTPTSTLDINARFQASNMTSTEAPTAFLTSNTRLPVPEGTFTAGPPGTPAQACPASLAGLPAAVVTACTRGSYIGPIRASVANISMGQNDLTNAPFAGMSVDQRVASLEAKWTTGFGVLTYSFGWMRNETEIEADGDFTSFPGPPGFVFSLSAIQDLGFVNDHDDHQLVWTGSFGALDLLLGGQVFTEKSTLLNDSKFWLRNPNSPLAGAPFFLARLPAPNLYPQFSSRNSDYSAIFGRVRWRVTDAFRLGLEVRRNTDDIDYFIPGWRLQDTSLSLLRPVCLPGVAQGATFAGVPGPGVPPPGTVQACERRASLSYTETTPRFTVDWQAMPNLMVYASAARGYKPGGFNTNEVTELIGQSYLPEFVDAYEVGFKSTFLDGRLVLNADIYYNDYTDQQIGVQRNSTGANGTVLAVAGIANAAAVESQGLEFDLEWQVTPAFSVDLGYAFNDATFGAFAQGPRQGSNAAAFAACGVPNGQTSTEQFRAEAGNVCADFSGNTVPKSPRHSITFAALYEGRLPAWDAGWYVELNGKHTSKRFVDEANLSWLPDYTLFDLMAGITFPKATVSVFVRNLTDDDTVRTAQRNIDIGTPEGFAPGRAITAYLPTPRTFGIRVSTSLP